MEMKKTSIRGISSNSVMTISTQMIYSGCSLVVKIYLEVVAGTHTILEVLDKLNFTKIDKETNNNLKILHFSYSNRYYHFYLFWFSVEY
jgi:hypothetical protein